MGARCSRSRDNESESGRDDMSFRSTFILSGFAMALFAQDAFAQCSPGYYQCDQYCVPSGAVCCTNIGRPDRYCPGGTTCQYDGTCTSDGPTGGTCSPGNVPCGDGCMPSGSVCCGNGYCDAGWECGSGGTCTRGSPNPGPTPGPNPGPTTYCSGDQEATQASCGGDTCSCAASCSSASDCASGCCVGGFCALPCVCDGYGTVDFSCGGGGGTTYTPYNDEPLGCSSMNTTPIGMLSFLLLLGGAALVRKKRAILAALTMLALFGCEGLDVSSDSSAVTTSTGVIEARASIRHDAPVLLQLKLSSDA